jgi:hypothetical protein
VLEPAKEASLWRTLVLPRAHAGHTSQRDPSYVEGGVFEDLAVSGDSELGLRSFPAQRYCRVHYLVAGAQPDKTTHDASLGGVTLLLEGSVRAKDGSETPLRVRTALAHGRTIELSSALSPAPSELSTLEITFTRALAGLLDDLELATASEKEIERGALRNLLAHMKIEARWR